jgi:hypothetical protein
MKILLVLFLTLLNIANAATEGETVKEQLPKRNKYEYIKNDAVNENREVFNLYEKENTKKVIFICTPNFFSYRVMANWDLDIKNKADAEKFAKDVCAKSYSGYVLLGYKINKLVEF